MLEVREARSPFGRVVKWIFLAFQVVMVLLMLGTCAAVGPFLSGPDPEVAIGAGMFGAMAMATLWTVWPLGTLLLGLLVLFTRGRKRLIPAPAVAQNPSPAAPGTVPQQSSQAAPPRGGSVPDAGNRP
jgi:hypothetical protein